MKDRRLLFHLHGRKFYLAPPRRQGGPYYIRFEPPSNSRKRIRVVHRSLRTNVVAAAKARAKLIIEPILNGQWEAAEKLKSTSGYAAIGELLERYQAGASDRANTVRKNRQCPSASYPHGARRRPGSTEFIRINSRADPTI